MDKIISFDFDGTLHTSADLQSFAKFLIERNVEVCITTRRSNIAASSMKEYPFEEVETLARKLGIQTINYLHGEYKHTFFAGKYNYIHIDDDELDIKLINFDRWNDVNDVICFDISQITEFKNYILNEFSTQRK